MSDIANLYQYGIGFFFGVICLIPVFMWLSLALNHVASTAQDETLYLLKVGNGDESPHPVFVGTKVQCDILGEQWIRLYPKAEHKPDGYRTNGGAWGELGKDYLTASYYPISFYNLDYFSDALKDETIRLEVRGVHKYRQGEFE